MDKYSDLQKHELANALESYFKDRQAEAKKSGQEFSQNDLAGVIGRSSSYISYIFNKQFDKKNASGHLILTDRIWSDIREFLKYDSDVWELKNYRTIMTNLLDAKVHHYQYIFDGDTGVGKTFTAGLFRKKFPKNTFYVKCYADMTITNFIHMLAKEVGLSSASIKGSVFHVREAVCNKLLTLSDSIIIVDECEKTTQSARLKVIDALQSMHDFQDLFKRCSFIVMGANDFYEQLVKICKRQNPHSVPQFLSRFDTVFLEKYSLSEARRVCTTHYQITDKLVIEELIKTSSDYRQLARRIERYLNDKKLKAA